VLQDATGTVTGSGYDGELFPAPSEITPPATLTPATGDFTLAASGQATIVRGTYAKTGSAAVQLTAAGLRRRSASRSAVELLRKFLANACPICSGAIRLDHDRHHDAKNRPADGETRRPGRHSTPTNLPFFLRGQYIGLRAGRKGGEA